MERAGTGLNWHSGLKFKSLSLVSLSQGKLPMPVGNPGANPGLGEGKLDF